MVEKITEISCNRYMRIISKPWLRLSLGLFFLSASALLFLWAISGGEADNNSSKIVKISEIRHSLSTQLSNYFLKNQFPAEAEIELDGAKQVSNLIYTIDPGLQTQAEKLIKSYKPDYAAIVILNADTGAVKAMVSFQKDNPEPQNWALNNSFPAASIFKIVTATAALDKKNLDPDSIIMFNGNNHTLYKKNVMSTKVNRWTREMTIKEAFAKSVNTVFGRISLEKLEPTDIREYAIRFGFNRNIDSDLPFDPGFAEIPADKSYQLTELASGFNKVTKMSPIQGAMIAASVANDGVMKVPYVIDSITSKDGKTLFASEPVTAAITMNKDGADKLKELMSATIQKGTSRKSFLSFLRDKKVKEVEVGGKTGSITGNDPKGKVDWFVGYAISDKEKLAIAAITVNVKYWTVKSSYVAQYLFKSYFKENYPNTKDFASKAPASETKSR